jgi:hypothetical protein
MHAFKWAALLALAVAVPALGQPGTRNPALGPPAGSATRSVANYLQRERALQSAIATHDQAAAAAMLDPDFEARTPASPDTSSRGAWLKGEFANADGQAQLRDLTVREADDLALVSFLLVTRRNATYFVVDLWRQSSGKLQARYIAAPRNAPPVSRKPDGRE